MTLAQSLRTVEKSQLERTIELINAMPYGLKAHYDKMYIANCNELAYRLYGKK